MAFDFPASPTLNQIYAPSGGPQYRWDGNAWRTTAAPGIYVAKTGDTMTGDLAISKDTPALTLNRPGGSANNAAIYGQYGGSPRWLIQMGQGVESSGNAGSNFYLTRFDDTGAPLGHALLANRATGNIGLGTAPTAARLTYANDTPYTPPLGTAYNQFRTILWDGGSAANVYGMGIENSNIGFNSGGGYKFYQAGGATPLMTIGGQGTTAVTISGATAVNNNLTVNNTFNVAMNNPNWIAPIYNTNTTTSANGMYVRSGNDGALAFGVLNAAANAYGLAAYGSGDLNISRNFNAGGTGVFNAGRVISYHPTASNNPSFACYDGAQGWVAGMLLDGSNNLMFARMDANGNYYSTLGYFSSDQVLHVASNIAVAGNIVSINGGQLHFNGYEWYFYYPTPNGYYPIWNTYNCPFSGGYSGYQKFANGTIIQWVNISGGSGGAAQSTFNWPTAFPQYCLYCIATFVGDIGTGVNSVVSINILNFDAAQCTTQPRYWVNGNAYGVASQPYIVLAIGF